MLWLRKSPMPLNSSPIDLRANDNRIRRAPRYYFISNRMNLKGTTKHENIFPSPRRGRGLG